MPRHARTFQVPADVLAGLHSGAIQLVQFRHRHHGERTAYVLDYRPWSSHPLKLEFWNDNGRVIEVFNIDEFQDFKEAANADVQ